MKANHETANQKTLPRPVNASPDTNNGTRTVGLVYNEVAYWAAGFIARRSGLDGVTCYQSVPALELLGVRVAVVRLGILVAAGRIPLHQAVAVARQIAAELLDPDRVASKVAEHYRRVSSEWLEGAVPNPL
mgnify:CR=1 FL=1